MSNASGAQGPEPRPEHDVQFETAAPVAPVATVGWQVIIAKVRVDSSTQDALIRELRELQAAGQKRIALDLKKSQFLSLPVIKACVEIAKELSAIGGAFALIACPEKTRRHFEIYGSLKQIRVVRTENDLALN